MAVALEIVVKQLTDSGIISPGKLESFVPPKATPKDGEELLRQLVQDKHLTKFQAQEIYQGRGKSLLLGNYTILDRIGAGGMGQVFKAEHRRMHRVVAIKMLPSVLTKDAAALARFEREVTAAAKLRHPNIVAADDADEANGVHFLVMEYVEGQDLSVLVKKNGQFPLAKAINNILQAARGLEFAHGEGVIHRDIKPANLLLDKKGVVKILDMGLARLDHPGGDAAAQAELTGTGAVMGTVDYMAPEQALNTKHADKRADIYSLGITLYYLIAGKCAYDGETLMEKLMAHQTKVIPSLKDVQPTIPDSVQTIFAKMVAKKREDRYQSMTEVIADLEHCQAGLGSSSTSATVKTSSSPDSRTSEITADLGYLPSQSAPRPEPSIEPKSTSPPRKKAGLLIGAGAAGFLFLLLGVWVIIRDKDGKEVTRVEVPEGGTATVQSQPSPKDAATTETTGPQAPVAPGQATKTIPSPGATGSASAPPLVAAPEGPASQPASIPAGGANSGDLDRAVAEWVIAGGGQVDVFKGPDQIKKLADLPAQPFLLKKVGLGKDQQLTPADARRLAALPQLGSVEIYGSEITAPAVAALRNCPRLKSLEFSRVNFPADALEAVLTLKRLTRVGFVICNLPDAIVARLGELPNLREIKLYKDRTVTDEGLIGLAKSPPPNLAYLNLTGTDVKKVTPAGLSAIATLPNLEKLSLDGTKTDDQALRALAAAKGLAEIRVTNTDVTRTGVDWLHQTLGHCLVPVSTVEQAGTLNGPAYQATIRKLLTRGFTFQAYVGNTVGTTNLKPDTPWPEGQPIAVLRATAPATVTLDDLRDLAQLHDLREISAVAVTGGLKFPAGSLGVLSPLKNLTHIFIGDAPLTDDEVQLLLSFPKLRSVHACIDGDASIAVLARLPHLTRLEISAGSKVTDDCLNSLRGVATLEALTLSPRSPITRPAAEAFAAARPDVTVTWNITTIEPPAAPVVGAAAPPPAVPAALPVADGAPGKVWSVGPKRVQDAYFLNNGNLLARDNTWGVVDPRTGARQTSVQFTLPDPQINLASAVALSPDQRWFVFAMRGAGNTKHQIFLADAGSGQLLRTLLDEQGRDTFSNPVAGLAVSPDGRRIVVSLKDAAPKSLAVFDVDSGKLIKRLAYSDTGDVKSGASLLGFTPAGKLAANDQALGLWLIDLDQETRQLVKLPGGFRRALALSADGRRALTAGGKKVNDNVEVAYLAVVDLAELKQREAKPNPPEMVFRRADISADGRWGITANKENLIQLWDLDTLTPAAEIGRESEPVSVVRFSPDGRFVLCGTDASPASGGTLTLYRLPREVWPAEEGSDPSGASSASPRPSPVEGEGAGTVKALVAPFNAAAAKAGQAAWAKHLGTQVETTNSIGAKMILIPPGEFLMGSTDEQVEAALKAAEEIVVDQFSKDRIQKAERPQHRVIITKPFLMSATEVTVAQFQQFVEATKYVTEAEQYGFGNSVDKVLSEKMGEKYRGANWKSPGFPVTHESPVTQVSWNDACAFCNWLSEQEQRTACYRPDGAGSWFSVAKGNGYRLPSEAQWEYACRPGTTTQYSFGDDWRELREYGWFNQNNNARAWPVGLKPANAFGLHDMHGNVFEWCEDLWDEQWYAKANPDSPDGPFSGSVRVLRGGEWRFSASVCRSAFRSSGAPSNRVSNTGFRCVRVW